MKMLWVAIVGLLAIGFSGCVDNEKSAPTEIPTPIYKVEYSTIADAGISYLKVKVTGISQDYKVILSDPNGSTTGIAYISKDDMIDGVETVDVQMSEYGKTPKTGAYTLLIKQILPEDVVYVTKPVFKKVLIDLGDIKFESSKYCYGTCEYTITKVKFTITNYGDIPVIINYALVGIGGEKYPATSCFDGRPRVMNRQESKINLIEGIAPNDSKEIMGNLYFPVRSRYRYDIDIALYSEQKYVTGSVQYFSTGCKE